MNMYSLTDLNSVWMKPIKTNYIKPEEEEKINAIVSMLMSEFTYNIHNFTNIIIHEEISKRPKASLQQKLLIKRQINSNVSENIKNIIINMAKDRYDFNNLLIKKTQTEPELIITDEIEAELIITDEIEAELIINDEMEAELIITDEMEAELIITDEIEA